MGRIDGLTFLLLPLTVNNRVNFLFYLSDKKVLWYAGLQDCSLKIMQYDILPLLSATKREKFWRYVKFWVIISEERNEI